MRPPRDCGPTVFSSVSGLLPLAEARSPPQGRFPSAGPPPGSLPPRSAPRRGLHAPPAPLPSRGVFPRLPVSPAAPRAQQGDSGERGRRRVGLPSEPSGCGLRQFLVLGLLPRLPRGSHARPVTRSASLSSSGAASTAASALPAALQPVREGLRARDTPAAPEVREPRPRGVASGASEEADAPASPARLGPRRPHPAGSNLPRP